MKRLAMFLCLLVARASLCHAEVPQAQVVLNGASFARGSFFSATFQLNTSITQPFTVFSVIIMPGGSMLDTMTLGPNIKPLASNVPSLAAPFTYPLISLNLPAGAPLGQYEVVVAFFDPSKPITGRQDAFLDVSGKFEIVNGNPTIPTPTPTQDWYLIYGPGGTGDVVKIGTMYVASKKNGQGCSYMVATNWVGALSWADGLNWLEKTDWRLPTKDELSAICAAKDTASGFTYRADLYWSSTGYDASLAWVVLFFADPNHCDVWNPNKSFTYQVRAVRDVEEP